MDADELLSGLTESQRHAVTHPASTLVVHAGAGSGKTRVLTHRIAHRIATGEVDPRHVLALTFTRRAAGELESRLRALGLRDRVPAGTFHAVALSQLRSLWTGRGARPPALLEKKLPFVRRLLGPTAPDIAAEIIVEIEWAKARMVLPEQYEAAVRAAGRRPPVESDRITAVYKEYEREKHRQRLIDFDDLLGLCRHQLESDREFAAAQHWRFRHIFVDEFQDLNPLQFGLLQAWMGTRDDLCAVGDPQQAIYAWNGSDAHFLTEIADYFPEAELVVLDENHRSTPQILELACAVANSGARPLKPLRPDGDPPTIVSYPNEEAEAQGVARAIRDARSPGARWASQAVLVRTHAQLAPIAGALEQMGVPYRVRSHRSDRGGVVPAHPGREPDGEHPTNDLADAVELCTFHAAKGLEWPVVHLAGLEEGLVPISHARTPDQLDEERRLLYVALTRAKRRLICSWAQSRALGDQVRSRDLSPFLAEAAGCLNSDRDLAAADPGTHIREQRERLGAARTPEAPRSGEWGLRPGSPRAGKSSGSAGPRLTQAQRRVLDRLEHWRRATARAAGVPPAVVLPDRTLRSLARAQPSSLSDLLATPGIGPVKARRYGEALLDLIAHQRAG